MSVVTDAKNEFKFVTKLPTTNWAARTLDADQRKYYDPLDKAAAAEKLPAPSRAGHLWRVELPDD